MCVLPDLLLFQMIICKKIGSRIDYSIIQSKLAVWAFSAYDLIFAAVFTKKNNCSAEDGCVQAKKMVITGWHLL